MSKHIERLTAADTMTACARAGVWLARGEDGRLYLWNQYNDCLEDRLSDRVFGALVRNQAALLRMVRHMDADTRDDVCAEAFSRQGVK